MGSGAVSPRLARIRRPRETDSERRLVYMGRAKADRIAYPSVLEEIRRIAVTEAARRDVEVERIEVRLNGWERPKSEPGVVVRIVVSTNETERFAYWDAVCDALALLADRLKKDERRFLIEDVSVPVSRRP